MVAEAVCTARAMDCASTRPPPPAFSPFTVVTVSVTPLVIASVALSFVVVPAAVPLVAASVATSPALLLLVAMLPALLSAHFVFRRTEVERLRAEVLSIQMQVTLFCDQDTQRQHVLSSHADEKASF